MENLSFKIRMVRAVLDVGERVLEKLPGADRIAYRAYRFTSSRIPEAFDGFRFVVLADVHAHLFGRDGAPLLDAIRATDPEVILGAGDWIRMDYSGKDARILREMVRSLCGIAPVYTILGNHEGRADHTDELVRDFTTLGARILQDESVPLYRGEDKEMIVLTGLYPSYENNFYGSLRESEAGPRMREEYSKVMEQLPPGDPFQIVLSHRPEIFPLYCEMGMDLVFSGHAHGGLMKLPGDRRLIAPDQGLFPAYTHGSYKKGRTTLVVSQGLGGPRVGIRPEIIVGELRRKEV